MTTVTNGVEEGWDVYSINRTNSQSLYTKKIGNVNATVVLNSPPGSVHAMLKAVFAVLSQYVSQPLHQKWQSVTFRSSTLLRNPIVCTGTDGSGKIVNTIVSVFSPRGKKYTAFIALQISYYGSPQENHRIVVYLVSQSNREITTDDRKDLIDAVQKRVLDAVDYYCVDDKDEHFIRSLEYLKVEKRKDNLLQGIPIGVPDTNWS